MSQNIRQRENRRLADYMGCSYREAERKRMELKAEGVSISDWIKQQEAASEDALKPLHSSGVGFTIRVHPECGDKVTVALVEEWLKAQLSDLEFASVEISRIS